MMKFAAASELVRARSGMRYVACGVVVREIGTRRERISSSCGYMCILRIANWICKRSNYLCQV